MKDNKRLRKAINRAIKRAAETMSDWYVMREGACYYAMNYSDPDFGFWTTGMEIIACVEPNGTIHE